MDKFGQVHAEQVARGDHRQDDPRLDHGGQQRDRHGPADQGRSAKSCKEKGVIFHTDAVQAVGKVPVDVEEMGIDLLSLSAHKIYGPKGIGALYVRKKDPRVRLDPMIDGGGHERGFRSGTLAVQQIVGIGTACELARLEMPTESQYLLRLREKLREGHHVAIAATCTSTAIRPSGCRAT